MYGWQLELYRCELQLSSELHSFGLAFILPLYTRTVGFQQVGIAEQLLVYLYLEPVHGLQEKKKKPGTTGHLLVCWSRLALPRVGI